MDVYEQILKNNDYLEIVKNIEKTKFITDGKWDWEHGLGHFKRVADYVKKILLQLNANERTVEIGMAAALLHDIGLSESSGEKTDHAIKGSRIFRNFISATNITKAEEKIIEHAIADHSKGNDINSLIDVALVLADKLDVTYHRTENSSIQDEMNKEIQKIRDVDIEINDKKLILKYKTNGKFDVDMLLKNWGKPITIPQKIAKHLNLNFIFMINDKEVVISDEAML